MGSLRRNIGRDKKAKIFVQFFEILHPITASPLHRMKAFRLSPRGIGFTGGRMQAFNMPPNRNTAQRASARQSAAYGFIWRCIEKSPGQISARAKKAPAP